MSCISAEKVTYIIDACYAGGMARGNGEKWVPYENAREYREVVEDDQHTVISSTKCTVDTRKIHIVIGAAKEDQKAFESERVGLDYRKDNRSVTRGVFTYYMVEEVARALTTDADAPVSDVIQKASYRTNRLIMKLKTVRQEARVVDLLMAAPTVGEVFGLD